jgi:xylan 1,4-beta-xylosidase
VIRRALLAVAAFALSVGAASTAAAQTQGAVTIEVDATAAGAPLEPVWRFYGYDEVNYTTSAEGEDLLRTLAAAQQGPVNVRTHFLFNSGDGTPALKWGSTNLYSEDSGGNPVYDYALIDAIMGATLNAGATPLVELGFMPEALSTRPVPYQNSNTYLLDGGCFYPPRDYDRWAGLVTAWATHAKSRYPGAESWQWELWNEPDIGYWHGTFEDYARLYDYTEAALHAVFPDASLGAPAVASPDLGFLAQFLQHCATGTNAVSGQTGTRLDMVSFHAKGGVIVNEGHVQMDLGNQLRLHRVGFDSVAASPFAAMPIVISEADPDGCAACPLRTAPQNAYRNSPAYGAYEVAMMKHTLDLAAEVGVNLRGVLTWAFTFPGSPYFAGYRALATNGIHLPVLNAFELLGNLRGVRLPVASSGARTLADLIDRGVRQAPDVDALASMDGDRIQILVWNYHDDLVDAPPAPITLVVAIPPALGTRLEVTHTRVDDTHGDAFTVWTSQGSPEAPSAEQLASLREAMGPLVLSRESVARVADEPVSLSFGLPRFGLSLVTIASEKEHELRGAPVSDSSCSFRWPAPARGSFQALLALVLATALHHRRRR